MYVNDPQSHTTGDKSEKPFMLCPQKVMQTETRPGKIQFLIRWFVRLALLVVLLVTLAALYWLRGGIYNRCVRFPREEAAWQALRAQRKPVPAEKSC